MKKLVILCLLLTLSLSASKSSYASGSCTPNYLAYSSVSCTFTGDTNVLEFYYCNGGTIYQSLWGSVGAGGTYVYNYITTPNGFIDLAVSTGQPDKYASTWGYNNAGTVILYTESVGPNNSGGVSASW